MTNDLKPTSGPEFGAFTLRTQSLTADRGGRTVFEGVNLTLENGGLIALTGTNGSGKSTLLRTLAGLLSSTYGAITLEGDSFYSDCPVNHSILYLGHQKALKLNMTLEENCRAWYACMTGCMLTEVSLMASLAHFSLSSLIDQPVKYFSSGQRQRAALSRFLLLDHPIWLMDEPTVGLDTKSKDALAQAIETHRKRGGAAIIATHDAITQADRDLSMDAYQPSSDQSSFWT